VRERFGDWSQTFTGGMFWPLDPREEEVCLDDIAHSLALQCRFAGHCRVPYSVAEHSVRVSLAAEGIGGPVCGPSLRLVALLHDAAEAYLVDVPRPIKPWLGGYHEIERAVQATVFRAFDVVPSTHELEFVKHLDLRMLATEQRDLMAEEPRSWNLGVEPFAERIEPWTWQEAEARFLARFATLRAEEDR